MEQNNENGWLAASRIALDSTACLQCLLKASQGLAENVSLMYCYPKNQEGCDPENSAGNNFI